MKFNKTKFYQLLNMCDDADAKEGALKLAENHLNGEGNEFDPDYFQFVSDTVSNLIARIESLSGKPFTSRISWEIFRDSFE